jgi:hypothetical protein
VINVIILNVSVKKQKKQMIYLSTTQSQSVVLTLSEKVSNPINPYYTWTLSNRDTLVTTTISPDNFSTSPYYDSFTLSIGTAVSLTSSVVMNLTAGEYHYSVYEMTTEYDLNIQNAIGLVETGLLMITGTSTPFVSFTASEGFTFTAFDNY